MSVANGTPFNAQALIDQQFVVTANLPVAANTVNTNGIDLVQAGPWPATNKVQVNFILSAGVGANNKNINCVWQQSNDNSSWTNVPFRKAPLFQVTDNANTNTNAANIFLMMDSPAYRYQRMQMTGEANGGTGANGLATFQLVF